MTNRIDVIENKSLKIDQDRILIPRLFLFSKNNFWVMIKLRALTGHRLISDEASFLNVAKKLSESYEPLNTKKSSGKSRDVKRHDFYNFLHFHVFFVLFKGNGKQHNVESVLSRKHETTFQHGSLFYGRNSQTNFKWMQLRRGRKTSAV